MNFVETGHDLFWWRRTANGWRTLVTIFWPDVGQAHSADFECALYDENGQLAAAWSTRQCPGSFLAIDSSDLQWDGMSVQSGVLSVRVVQPAVQSAVNRHRLYGTIDWYHETEGVASLHSDHCVLPEPRPLQFTEMVLRPSEQRDPYLVFMTAHQSVPAGSLMLELANDAGEVRMAQVDEPWLPYRVHRVDLSAHFGDLEAFGGGLPLSLSGRRLPVALFERPYLVSESPTLTAYHGGDRYDFDPLPGLHYRFLGEGEVNPMLVIADEEIETEVSFFNSHAGVEGDFWVGVRLYDHTGNMVLHVPRWQQARSAGPTHARLADLLPKALRPFRGHAAFTFSEPDKTAYPRRLQALMAYLSKGQSGCARVMAWSDEWNTPIRRYWLARTGAPHYLSWYRFWCLPVMEVLLAITYAGSDNLTGSCTYSIRLLGSSGEQLVAQRSLEAFATDWVAVQDIASDAVAFVARMHAAVVLIESNADLAAVAVTRHKRAGVWSAEHFMSAPVRGASGEAKPAGR